jgi:hypothetical protein
MNMAIFFENIMKGGDLYMTEYSIVLDCNPKGFNEVHKNSCIALQIANNTQFLGNFNDAVEAVAYAKENGYPKADGCSFCSKEANSN